LSAKRLAKEKHFQLGDRSRALRSVKCLDLVLGAVLTAVDESGEGSRGKNETSAPESISSNTFETERPLAGERTVTEATGAGGRNAIES
jgi:hypothetical protein